jgi:hypothetical protein
MKEIHYRHESLFASAAANTIVKCIGTKARRGVTGENSDKHARGLAGRGGHQ